MGKQQHYQLGQWLRTRYNGFLPSHYSEKDIYIRSTDADRTLMSAEANLAGLYPPKNDQIWDPSIPWQPIPVHTTPELEDNLLSMKKVCPKYNTLLSQLFKTDYFQNISRINHDLYVFLTKYTGTQIDTLEKLEFIYNTLYIESSNKLELPEWTKKVYPDKMRPWAQFSFATPCFTQDLARLKSGPLFHEIIEHFQNATRNVTDFRKFLVFSAHDITIANVLNTMGAFQYHCPPYASTIIFELRRSNFTYINIFYKNSSLVQNITMKGCDFNCNFNEFIEILKPIIITRKEWDLECQMESENVNCDLYFNFIIYLSSLIGFLVFVFVLWAICKCIKLPNEAHNRYTKLPSDETA